LREGGGSDSHLAGFAPGEGHRLFAPPPPGRASGAIRFPFGGRFRSDGRVQTETALPIDPIATPPVPSPHAAHIFAAPRHPRVPFRVRRSISTVDRTITIKRGECKGGLLSHCVRGPRAKCFREIFSCLSLQLSLPSPPLPRAVPFVAAGAAAETS